MNGQLTLAKRYATAYLNIYEDQLDLHASQRSEQAAHFFNVHAVATLVLKLSIIPFRKKRDCIADVFKKFRLPDSLVRLVDLLSQHNRLALLPDVLYQISELFKHRHGIAAYDIVSSKKLDAHACAIIVGFLEKLSGKKIISKEKIDQSLIAGIRLQSNTTLWEYSIQKQLRELEHHFNV